MKKFFALIMVVFVVMTISVSAHDTDYGKTHNHYDYVVVAHIDSYTGETADLTVVKHIISSVSCGDNKGSHIPPEKMTVTLRDKVIYPDAYNEEYGVLKSGIQNIVAVINNEEGKYRFLWIYETDSDDYRTLQIISPKMKDKDMISDDTAAFNDFINSDGKNNDFVFDSGIVKRRNGTVIYTPEEGYIAVRTAADIEKTDFIITLAGIAAGILLLCIIIFIIAKIIKFKKR